MALEVFLTQNYSLKLDSVIPVLNLARVKVGSIGKIDKLEAFSGSIILC